MTEAPPWANTQAPAEPWATTQPPAESWAPTQSPAGSWTNTQPPAGSWINTQPPAEPWATTQPPAESWANAPTPPWAPEPTPAPAPEPEVRPFGGTVPPYGSPENKHGQLLVRFPGEVHLSGRPPAPSWRPVAVFTFFLNVLGVIPAMRRAGRARRTGHRRAPYWISFGLALVFGTAFYAAVGYGAAWPIYQHFQEKSLTAALQETILEDGRIAKSVGATVSDPQCTPDGDRNADGLRTYVCTFTKVDGAKTSLFVSADTNGNWQLDD